MLFSCGDMVFGICGGLMWLLAETDRHSVGLSGTDCHSAGLSGDVPSAW